MVKDKFFDRTYYLDILERRFKGLKDGYRQNIAIIGDESIGKTSIVLRFLSYFQDNAIVPVYLDIRLLSLENFTRKFIGVLLYNFLRNSDIAMKEELDFLISKSEKYIPRTVEKIRQILASSGKRQRPS